MRQAPIGGWAQDPKLQEIGQYSQLALEQDLEGKYRTSSPRSQDMTPACSGQALLTEY